MTQRLPALTRHRFRLNPFRSPLLGASSFLSLPPGTEMFQFPGFTDPALCVQAGLTGHDPSRVSPFGYPWICGWLTPPQGFSQPPTSFFVSQCLGIHHVLLVTCRRDARARYGVLKDRPTSSGSLAYRLACGRRFEGSRTMRLRGTVSLKAAQRAHRSAGSFGWVTPSTCPVKNRCPLHSHEEREAADPLSTSHIVGRSSGGLPQRRSNSDRTDE